MTSHVQVKASSSGAMSGSAAEQNNDAFVAEYLKGKEEMGLH